MTGGKRLAPPLQDDDDELFFLSDYPFFLHSRFFWLSQAHLNLDDRGAGFRVFGFPFLYKLLMI